MAELGYFESLLNDPDPAFVCAGCPDRKAVRITRVHHEFRPGAADLSLLDDYCDPFGADIRSIYQRSDGMRLFVDQIRTPRLGFAAAFEFFPLDSWTLKRNKAAKLLGSGDWGFSASDLFLIGEPCGSGNLFALIKSGPNKGYIRYLDHDGGCKSILATSLGRFFDQIAKDPASLIYELGCYTRYCDGTTNEQWIPNIYLPNAAEQLASILREEEQAKRGRR